MNSYSTKEEADSTTSSPENTDSSETSKERQSLIRIKKTVLSSRKSLISLPNRKLAITLTSNRVQDLRLPALSDDENRAEDETKKEERVRFEFRIPKDDRYGAKSAQSSTPTTISSQRITSDSIRKQENESAERNFQLAAGSTTRNLSNKPPSHDEQPGHRDHRVLRSFYRNYRTYYGTWFSDSSSEYQKHKHCASESKGWFEPVGEEKETMLPIIKTGIKKANASKTSTHLAEQSKDAVSTELRKDEADAKHDSTTFDINLRSKEKKASGQQRNRSLCSSMESLNVSQPDKEMMEQLPKLRASTRNRVVLSRATVDNKKSKPPKASTSGTSVSTADTRVKDAGKVKLPPRKRKQAKSASSSTLESAPAAAIAAILQEMSFDNSYQMGIDVRKQYDEKWRRVIQIRPKPPPYFKHYLINQPGYTPTGTSVRRLKPFEGNPPDSIPEVMRNLYKNQENGRREMIYEHDLQKERLVISVEEEIIREHANAGRTLSGQSIPFSACAFIKDQECYNVIPATNQEPPSFDAGTFNSRLKKLDDKWEKIKEETLKRHILEAQALQAQQKIEWYVEMCKHKLRVPKTFGDIDNISVPIVVINDGMSHYPSDAETSAEDEK